MSKQEVLDSEKEWIYDFLNPEKPLILLLDISTHEGILSALSLSGRQYKMKSLSSSPKNWETINALFAKFRVSAVLAKVNDNALTKFGALEYRDISESLLKKIGCVPNQVYIYEGCLYSNPIGPIMAGGRQYISKENPYGGFEKHDEALSLFRSNGVNINLFRRNAEVTVLAEAFLERLDKNLLLRIYIPFGRLWSNEVDKLLQLFQEYLTRVDGLTIRLDRKRTDCGGVYEFHGQAPLGDPRLSAKLQEFTSFIDLCGSDLSAASTLLNEKSLDSREVVSILERYSKEVRRLQIDIKHASESKLIEIRHRLESELVEMAPTQQEWHNISILINSIIPSASVGLPSPSSVLNPKLGIGISSTNQFLRPELIDAVKEITAEEIDSRSGLTKQDRQILDIIYKYGLDDVHTLESAMQEVTDKGVDHSDRVMAMRKVKEFLIMAGRKTGDIAISILAKYIEKRIGL